VGSPAHRIILGVDPGLTRTGWGIVRTEGARLIYVDSGTISSRPAGRMGSRLLRIFEELSRIAAEHGVTHCAVESGYVGKSAQSALKLGQARAAAVLALERSGVEVLDVAPREVKLAVTGRGGAAKEQVSYIVEQMLGLEFGPGEQDISDALGAAVWAAVGSERRLAVPAL